MNSRTQKRVLVVEDDPSMRLVLGKAVTSVRPDLEISYAESLERAFAKILQCSDISDKKPYEMIIADIFLEGHGTGLDLWKVICGTYPEIPIMVISSVDEEDIVSAIGEEHRQNLIFMKKPFTVKSCGVKIQTVLGRLPEEKIEPALSGRDTPADAFLMDNDERQLQMAHLLMLKISADWLSKQAWLDEPYGGQNPAQELLFHSRISAHKLWEDFFVSKDNKLTLDKEKVREHILQMSELTPELKEFLDERLHKMESFFHSH